MPCKILLQTTLLPTEDDNWTIRRFSLLQNYLTSLKDESGDPLLQIIARDRTPDSNGDDPMLSQLDDQGIDELWLFALDVGGGLSQRDCDGITRFHRQGGGILTTRDHQDMGISMCALPTIGGFHYFHSRQNNPDSSRCCRDDIHNTSINWPNYHSGKNGDYQKIEPIELTHELLSNPKSPDGIIRYFPAHPHEGDIGIPKWATQASVIAHGTSKITGRVFNLAIASDHIQDESGNVLGRVVAESTFHHFVDYNWDIEMGCPTFVEEMPGDGFQKNPVYLDDIHAYIKNIALWLAK